VSYRSYREKEREYQRQCDAWMNDLNPLMKLANNDVVYTILVILSLGLGFLIGFLIGSL
jgi:hypothetical protein